VKGWDNKLCYAVPRHKLSPLASWLDAIRDGVLSLGEV
jgi:hypothetical protein